MGSGSCTRGGRLRKWASPKSGHGFVRTSAGRAWGGTVLAFSRSLSAWDARGTEGGGCGKVADTEHVLRQRVLRHRRRLQ
eukprot:1009188-Rhodomonas_salina.2